MYCSVFCLQIFSTMSPKSYRRLDLVAGWILFIIASAVYLLTMEPTASFWDCGEFIACADKLIVGHPPGAPFFMLIMRMFTMLAPTPELVGVFANSMSALASGATIMFLYWSIAYFARRMVVASSEEQPTLWQTILIMSASAIGALCYTFTDTFWFSAVEGEVYALSSLFTALVFWAILKWEHEAGQPRARRWIVLIALLMGLSIGVHLLNLLAIPAIVLVYYFKLYKFSWWGLVKALAIGAVLLLTTLYGVIQGLVILAAQFELLFVNGFHLPYLTGAAFFFAALVVGLVIGIWKTRQRGATMANLLLTCAAMLLLGYSSYAVILIRSLANPTLDQNGVDNMFSLRSYLNREQYGDRPLLSGPYYNAPVVDYKDGAPTYAPRDGKYRVVNSKTDIIYDSRFTTIFPRMWSRDNIHVQGYKSWVNIKGRPITVTGRDGKQETINVPTFGENLAFFFSYQVGFMYWRYFMWNFSGRQNDYQGYGHDALRGNWISGIPFIDDTRLGPQDQLPEPYRSNRARNRYYMLPLLLGIAGLVSHFRRRTQDAGVVLTLFFLTGVAIVMYLNQKPFEPRERDYTFAASFYAFAIWVGLGMIPFARFLARFLRERIGVAVASIVALLGVPVLMGSQNWDDHDRSHRYISVDFGKNMLNSSEKDGILFTYADNDTFPLWYAQEAEGFRRDVRICNLTYLGGDWYVDVMNRKAYEADPLPFNLKREDYLEGKNDIVLVQNVLGRPYDLKQALNFVLSNDPRTKVTSPYVGGSELSYFPTNTLTVPVPASVRGTLVPQQFDSAVLDTLTLKPTGNLLYKNGFAMYCLLANNNWQRPLYYSPLLPKDMYWGLDRYFVSDAVVSEVLPVDRARTQVMTDTARANRLLMKDYSFRSFADPRVYVDETCKRMSEYYLRAFASAIEATLVFGEKGRAEQLIDRCFEVLPPSQIDWSYNWLPIVEGYYRCGAKEKGAAKVQEYALQCIDVLSYAYKLPVRLQGTIRNDQQMALGVLQELEKMATLYDDAATLKLLDQLLGEKDAK